MFRKKATPWVMAVTMLGMMGAIEAQTLEEQYLNELSPRLRRFTKWEINQAAKGKLYQYDGLYPAADDVKEIYATGARNAGAPHVEDIYTPPPDPFQHCRDVIAWGHVGDNYNNLIKAIGDASKQAPAPLFQYSFGFPSTYYSAICGKQ